MLKNTIIAGVIALAAGRDQLHCVKFRGDPIPWWTASDGRPSGNLEHPVAAARDFRRQRWFYHRHFYGNRHLYGPRYRYRYGRYAYFHGGWWYPRPWWRYGGAAVALTVGPAVGYYAYSGGNPHVRWCLGHYRSYNPRTDSFVGYDGLLHRCNSPFDGLLI